MLGQAGAAPGVLLQGARAPPPLTPAWKTTGHAAPSAKAAGHTPADPTCAPRMPTSPQPPACPHSEGSGCTLPVLPPGALIPEPQARPKGVQSTWVAGPGPQLPLQGQSPCPGKAARVLAGPALLQMSLCKEARAPPPRHHGGSCQGPHFNKLQTRGMTGIAKYEFS